MLGKPVLSPKFYCERRIACCRCVADCWMFAPSYPQHASPRLQFCDSLDFFLGTCSLVPRPGAQLVSVTRRNVRSADATLIFGACRTPETLLPLHEAQRQGQPVLVVEWTCLDPDPDAERLRQWLVANKVETLHVAGSRKHWRDHGVFEATKRFLIEGLTEREADVERASESSRQAPILAGPPTGIHEGDTCLEDDMGVWLSPQAFSQMGAEIWRHFTLYDQCAPGRRIMPHLKTYFRLRSNGKHRRSNSCSSNSQGRATQHELVWMMFGSMYVRPEATRVPWHCMSS